MGFKKSCFARAEKLREQTLLRPGCWALTAEPPVPFFASVSALRSGYCWPSSVPVFWPQRLRERSSLPETPARKRAHRTGLSPNSVWKVEVGKIADKGDMCTLVCWFVIVMTRTAQQFLLTLHVCTNLSSVCFARSQFGVRVLIGRHAVVVWLVDFLAVASKTST